jgi:DNA-binding NarL/FixJ family response regulator
MDSSNGLLIELLRSAQSFATADFQQHALQLIRSVCRFDMATWGTGTFQANTRPKYHSISLHGIPSDVYRDYDKIAHVDGVSDEVVRHPSQGIVAFNPKDQFVAPRYRDYLVYMNRYAFNNLLYATTRSPVAKSLRFISLVRSDNAATFTKADIALSQDLLSFAIEAGVINHRLSTSTCKSPPHQEKSFQAIATTTGVVMSADEGFHELVSRQWPEHRTPFLPQELLRALMQSPDRKYFGTVVVASASLHAGMLLIAARTGNRLGALTPSQLEVAKLIASGCSNKEAAARLCISAATVRNHLTAAYAKLGLEHKAASGGCRSRKHGQSHWKKAALVRWWIEHEPL